MFLIKYKKFFNLKACGPSWSNPYVNCHYTKDLNTFNVEIRMAKVNLSFSPSYTLDFCQPPSLILVSCKCYAGTNELSYHKQFGATDDSILCLFLCSPNAFSSRSGPRADAPGVRGEHYLRDASRMVDGSVCHFPLVWKRQNRPVGELAFFKNQIP